MLLTDVTPAGTPPRHLQPATPVWVEKAASGRNQFVSFEREFDADADQGEIWLHVFADTRYRLYLNGTFLAYGPGRFVTQYPEYDSFELSGQLRTGRNHLRVEVNFYGASSYQSMPDGKPGFMAAGGDAAGTVDFATPGEWSCRIHHAWDAQAPLFSFAQNPAEICDTRVLRRELACPADAKMRILGGGDAPWGEPRPRSVDYPDYRPMRPERISVAGPLVMGKRLLAIQTNDPDFQKDKRGTRYQQRVLSWIYSPKAHDCELDCLWVDLQLNGQPLERRGPTSFGNHEVATLSLREGWNLLTARYAVLLEHWTLLFGYPLGDQITWHAHPDRSVAAPFLVSGMEKETAELPAFSKPESFTAPAGWKETCGDPDQATPARRIAWDEFNEARTIRNVEMASFQEVSAFHAECASWCFYFGDEYYGHPLIEVEAPEGTILDIAYDDWQREDGATNLYSSNPFTDAADRFILAGGRQTIEACNPRGGIYLQVTLRAPQGEATLVLHDVVVCSRRLLEDPPAGLVCGNPVFEWAWAKSLHTLVASTDEGYADCPWRERGSYIGDSFVNLHLNGLVTADYRIARRVMRVFGEAQLENGQLAPVAPAWHQRPHEDFTLIWLQCLRDYWCLTGDATLLEEMWPHVERLWASPSWKEGPSGLWDAIGMNVFLDWGKLPSETEGEANACLNLFRLAGARATAQIAEVLGMPEAARRFSAEAARVKRAIEATLWNKQQGRFLPALGADTPAVHANILALLHGVGDPDRLLAYLEPLLRANFRFGIDKGQGSGYAEMYFFIYLLPALAKHGRHRLAESLIEEHYGFLKGLGYPTLNECFSRAHRNTGSCCHSWSGAAAVYFARHLLGLRQAQPGNRDIWVVDPVAVTVDRAAGSLPHPRGDIRVDWQRQGGRIRARVSAPAGVEIRLGDGVERA